MSKIILEEQASAGTPSTNLVSVYPIAGGRLLYKNDTGTEYLLGGQNTAFLTWRVAAAGAFTLTNSAYTLLNISTVKYDPGNYFEEVSTFKYTPPTGNYLIGGHLYPISAVGDQQVMSLGIFKNGTIAALLDYKTASGTTPHNWQGCALFEANGSDYFDLRFFHSTGADKTVTAGSDDHISFWGFPIMSTAG